MTNATTLGLGLLGFALPVLALAGLLFRRPQAAKGLRLAPPLLAAAGAALAWALGFWLAPVVLLTLSALFLVTTSTAVGRLLGRGVQGFGRARVQWCALLMAGPALAVAWVCRDQANQSPPWSLPPDVQVGRTPASLRPVKTTQALTDAGQPVPLYRTTDPAPTRELRDYERRLVQNMAGDMIATDTGTGTLASNCHGWVFTGGRYWVQSDAVGRIVKDNGYREVKAPQAGDLVVYRESDGRVVHSGVVRYVDERGGALVESKWGVVGCFLHPADRHCYVGADPAFFRSPRTGHLLRGLSGSTDGTLPPPTTAARGRAPDAEHEAEAVAAAEARGAEDGADAD